jgi:hypothetical protein
VIIWHLLNDPAARYTDLGPDFYTRHVDTGRKTRSLIHQLEAHGRIGRLTAPVHAPPPSPTQPEITGSGPLPRAWPGSWVSDQTARRAQCSPGHGQFGEAAGQAVML